jgi:hypothetical protein
MSNTPTIEVDTPVAGSEKRRRHGHIITLGGNSLWWAWHQIWWTFPLILLSINWIAGMWIPGLRLPVTSWMSQENTLWLLGALVVNLILAIVWEYSEFSKITYQFASVRSLRINARASITTALFSTALSAALLRNEGILWWVVVPTIAAIFDAFVSADRGINNAVGKSAIEQTEDEIQRRVLEKRAGG